MGKILGTLFLLVALATTFVHCDKEKAPKIDPNAVKTAADLEKLLSEMSEKGFHEAVDLLSRGEMELDQEKMAVFEKYLESHEAVLDLPKPSNTDDSHFREIHSVGAFDAPKARSELRRLVVFLRAEHAKPGSQALADYAAAKEKGDFQGFDFDLELKRHYTLEPKGLVRGLDDAERRRVNELMYELHELMNARHREDIDELEKLEQAYEASLKDKVAKSEKRSADPGTAYHDPADATDRHAMDMANGHADIDGFGTDDHDDDTAEYEHNAEDDDENDDDDDDDKPWHSEL
eukprot:TRINITY_DN931_c0_g1_i2.p1 TRINITY_DN931_c0_g1~~TRINITY_DN931_c0_g1_i2.p1  ORF type:complete len:303 (+),score=82.67 TRINITY_DN931_c0_g1_i2:37-909(+)